MSEYLKAVRARAACFMEMREGGVIVNGWREVKIIKRQFVLSRQENVGRKEKMVVICLKPKEYCYG
ncbi:hypothetical protein J42TS3_03360 [Paenibacillus vini]|uniref:RNA-binding S4 domain-containing protein n=1 Tax=Paenibacillus vini TaxID=1476024 RepID=A0ABQ4M5L8_9BACL|nr:hypothetical protein J42TS3_03360 [Paenibacillus vini]